MAAPTYSVSEPSHNDDNEDEKTHAIAARIFSNSAIVDILSDLVAILESIKYEARPPGCRVFGAEWTRRLFKNCLPDKMKQEFDVENWYTHIASMSPVPSNKEFIGIIDPSLYNGEITTDWVTPLLFLEYKCAGFITMFHGIIGLETKARLKMIRHSKLTCNAGSYGIYDEPRQQTSQQQQQQPPDMDPVQKRNFIEWQQ